MDTRRFIVFVAISFAVLFGWQALMKQLYPQPPAGTPAATMVTAGKGAAAVPLPRVDTPTLLSGGVVTVKTDLVEAQLNTMGADLRGLTLLKHGQHEKPTTPFVLLQEKGQHTYVAQTGLVKEGATLPTHRTLFTTTSPAKVELAPGQMEVSVRFDAPEANGLKVSKVYTFKRDSYLIDVRYTLTNTGSQPVSPSAYFRLLRDGKNPDGSTGSSFFGTHTFTGPAVYTDESKFKKVAFSDIDKGKSEGEYPKTGRDGWVAMAQHYFVSAWVLSPIGGTNVCTTGTGCRFEVKGVGDGLYSAGAIVDMPVIAPGQTVNVTVPLYAGPQETRRLDATATGLDLVKDYGMFAVLAKPMFWLLDKLHTLVGNWGWAIVLLTLIIKLAVYPLYSASYRSMAKMKKLAPRMQQLQERYKDDRMKFQQSVMELYKTEKVNPLGGCLPILVPIPIFIALYWVLLSAVEMRQAPWIGWITDLSVPDPYFILPIVMAVSMYAQTLMNPPATDPLQDKMMKIMPLVFSVMFFFFPAGLVLYWVANNLFSIAQQWYITKKLEREEAAHKAKAR
jgi:YidC/Oxa1 family membrane protein insertase